MSARFHVLDWTRPDWFNWAACRGRPRDWWFPGPKDVHSADTKQALAICGACRARRACGRYALERPLLLGIWGGMNERQRRKERKRRKAA